jgi:catechol 2,3-dioxygenase-like lactoylglutathione lyase family enzyme
MLHHVEIYVSDLETSRAFYDFLLTKLGYSLYQEWEDGLSFKKAEQYTVFSPLSNSRAPKKASKASPKMVSRFRPPDFSSPFPRRRNRSKPQAREKPANDSSRTKVERNLDMRFFVEYLKSQSDKR